MSSSNNYEIYEDEKIAGPVLEKVLSGHSGAEILLYKEDQCFFIRKISGAQNKNKRLEAQARKQKQGLSCNLSSPVIFADGYSEKGLYYFDMAYITGASVSHIVARTMFNFERKDFRAFLNDVVHHYLQTVKNGQSISQADILGKIARIEENCTQNTSLSSSIKDRIKKTIAIFKSLVWPDVPASSCHGDLTLENIIKTPSHGFVLIDFDDVDLSSVFLDLCKTLQDTTGFWCLRHMALDKEKKNEYLSAQINIKRVEKEVLSLIEEHFPTLLPCCFNFVGLHLLRTLPYTQDDGIASFTLDRIEVVLRRGNKEVL